MAKRMVEDVGGATSGTERPRTGQIAAGIDVGSTYIKVALINSSKEVLGKAIGDTGFDYRSLSVEVTKRALGEARIGFDDIGFAIATGYGRRMVPFADEWVTEISCHARGVHSLFPQARMVVDLGGQDSKVIALNQNGQVGNFVMNDKCAAGTGRFLEVMARALQVSLDDMGKMALTAKESVQISNVCTVFAESEVISLLASGCSRNDILAGIFDAISRRISGMVLRCGRREPLVMTGGVAKNIGMVKSLEKVLAVNILVPAEPQMVGALGAGVIALERMAKARTGQS